MQNAQCRMRNAECRMQNCTHAGFATPDGVKIGALRAKIEMVLRTKILEAKPLKNILAPTAQ